MVKGAAKRAVIVRPADTQPFEQAIFIVDDGAAGGMTQGQLLQEAHRITGCCAPIRKLGQIKAPLAFAVGLGAGGSLGLLGAFFF